MKKNLILLISALMIAFNLVAQDNLVDLFSGDFHYNVPIMVVPSSDGPDITLDAGYRSNIAVHQKSSWIGLGWDLDIGEIRRDVNGVPDDWNGVSRTTNVYDYTTSWNRNLNESSQTSFYGPLYFQNFGTRTIGTSDTLKEMDIYASSGGGAPFYFPDYDNFTVSTPGVSGTFQPLILDVGTMVKRNALSPKGTLKYSAPGSELPLDLRYQNYGSTNPGNLGTSNECEAFLYNRPVQFRYMGEMGKIDISDAAANTYVTGAALEQVSSTYYNAIGGKNIIFYTKQDFVNNASKINELIKYPGFNYTGSQFRNSDIVAFKITNEAGFSYYYSLPVLAKNQKTINIEMAKFSIADAKRIKVTSIPDYVVAWKLTAVTGPDFVDAGTISTIDAADKGYWVKYTYALWDNAFKWQTPYYDSNRNFGEDVERLQQDKETYPFQKESLNSQWGEFTDQGNISKGESQLYYLEKIETASHTAFFVKEIRNDEHSKKQGSTLPTPALSLRRIILMNSSDASSFNTGTALTSSVFTVPAVSSSIYNEARYQAIKTTIDPLTVAAVEFVQDFSLCKNYYGNVYNTVSVTSTAFSFTPSTDNFTYETYNSAGTTASNSGKLSLIKIVPYGIGAAANLSPSTQFQYSAINPDFHPHKRDFWGYYQKEWTSTRPVEYQTANSISDISAWNLTKIATPLGGIIEVEYESDKYNKVAMYDKKISRVFGGRFYPKNTTYNSTSYSYDMFVIDDIGLKDLISNSGSGIGSISLEYPCKCNWTTLFYYPPSQTSGDYLISKNTALEKRVYSSSSDIAIANITTAKTEIKPLGSATSFLLNTFCGEGPDNYTNVAATITDRKYELATATVTLSYAYGGGIRVKNIKLYEVDVNSIGQTQTIEYQYDSNDKNLTSPTGYGVASIEPGRYTPPLFSRRPQLRDLYDRHSLSPAVGYSKVIVKEKGVNNVYKDNYNEYVFNNYDDWRAGEGGRSVGVHNGTNSDIYSNWDNYLTCLKTCSFNNTQSAIQTNCYAHCGAPPTPIYSIEALKNTGMNTALDRSRTFLGRLVSAKSFDKNGRLLNASESEYERVNTTSSAFHQKSHGVIPITYDKNFIGSSGAPVYQEYGFGPFNSAFAAGHSTLLNTSMFYKKVIQNDRMKKMVVAQNDIRSVTEYTDFDPITGSVKKAVTKDPSTGELIENEREYAYTNSAYSIFGPKSRYNTSNKNLLNLISLETVKKNGIVVNGIKRDFTNSALVRAWSTGTSSFTTATTTIPWSAKKTYVYNGDPSPANWREDIEFTLFNSKGNVLEQKHYINSSSGRYSMLKLGYNSRFVITSCNDSRYTESTYSGAEDTGETSGYYSGEVKISVSGGTTNTTATLVHTGKKSLGLTAGGKGFEYKVPCSELVKDRAYLSRVWVYRESGNSSRLYYEFKHNTTNVVESSGYVTYSGVDGANNQGYVTNCPKWALLTLKVIIPTSGNVYTNFNNYTLYVRCENMGTATSYFDDFRFHPISSGMTNYVFNSFTGLPEYMIDENGFYLRSTYDGMGRLYEQFVETTSGEVKLSEINRNFYRFSTSNPF
jgi:hypothetical protein